MTTVSRQRKGFTPISPLTVIAIIGVLPAVLFPGAQGGPLEHVIAAKAVCFAQCDTPEFKEYAKQVVANSLALAD